MGKMEMGHNLPFTVPPNTKSRSQLGSYIHDGSSITGLVFIHTDHVHSYQAEKVQEPLKNPDKKLLFQRPNMDLGVKLNAYRAENFGLC